MVSHRDKEHEFALYVHMLSEALARQHDMLRIDEVAVMHRIVHVLRLQKDDTLVLFDEHAHVRATITSIEKKAVTCLLAEPKRNIQIHPRITVWLPLLKREAFEEAIYALVELGVNEIQLVHTSKEQRHWMGQKEMQRMHNIMVAAAEQSKNFRMALVHEPCNLSDLVSLKSSVQGVFFDSEGEPLLEVVSGLRAKKAEHYILFAGPEGDLTDAEKFQLQKASFIFARLTPTVLRAQQALAVGVGVIRSFLH